LQAIEGATCNDPAHSNAAESGDIIALAMIAIVHFFDNATTARKLCRNVTCFYGALLDDTRIFPGISKRHIAITPFDDGPMFNLLSSARTIGRTSRH
jgi:hypothetical protein